MSRPCEICQAPVPSGSRGVTCGFTCRAKLRERRKTTEWRVPKQYPAELVERVRHLYVDQGMTITEVQAVIGKGVKVQRLMENHGIARRPRIKRDQRGERNSYLDRWNRANARSRADYYAHPIAGRFDNHRQTPCLTCSAPTYSQQGHLRRLPQGDTVTARRYASTRATPDRTGGDDRPAGACYGLAARMAPNPTPFDVLTEKTQGTGQGRELAAAKAEILSVRLCGACPLRSGCWDDAHARREPWFLALCGKPVPRHAKRAA